MKNYGMETMLPTAYRGFSTTRFWARKRGEVLKVAPLSYEDAIFKARLPQSLVLVNIQTNREATVALSNLAGRVIWADNVGVGDSTIWLADGDYPLMPTGDPKQDHYVWKIMRLKGRGALAVQAWTKFMVYDTDDGTPNRE